MSNKPSSPNAGAKASSLEKRQKDLQRLLTSMSAKFSESTLGISREIRISDKEFNELRDYIYKRSGIAIPATRKYLLENRLASRLRDLELESFTAYLHHLRQAPDRKEEENKLFELVTTNETSFYRNTVQLDVLQKIILPEVLEKKRASGTRSIHLWSAGCSTGEEPYTLSIIMHEVLKGELSRWRVHISAHDLSLAVLKAAQDGIYTEYALRTTPKEIVKAYFQQDDERYLVKPEVKRMVRFAPLNLNDADKMRRLERADVIFCRNVIIYFDTDMKKRVISSFEERLHPGGFLFIGHSETLHNISEAFESRNYPGTVVYQKPAGERL